jgi:hypothetical protein
MCAGGAILKRVVELEVVLFSTLPAGHRGLVSADTARLLEHMQLAKRLDGPRNAEQPVNYARRPANTLAAPPG